MEIVKRLELFEKLNPVIMSKKGMTLDEYDFEDIQEYMESVFTITAIEQSFLYTQGYLDCVNLLRTLGVFQ